MGYQSVFIPMKLMSNLKRKNKSLLFSHAVIYPIPGEPFETPASLSHLPHSVSKFYIFSLSLSWSRSSTTLLGIFSLFSFLSLICTSLQAPLPCLVLYTHCWKSDCLSICYKCDALFSWLPSCCRVKSSMVWPLTAFIFFGVFLNPELPFCLMLTICRWPQAFSVPYAFLQMLCCD